MVPPKLPATTAQALRAYFTARDLVDIDGLRVLIDKAALPRHEQLCIQRQVRTLLEQLSTWLLRHPGSVATPDQLRQHRDAIRELTERFAELVSGDLHEHHRREVARLSALRVAPSTIARLAPLAALAAAPDVAAVASEAASGIDVAARSLFRLQHELSVNRVRDRIADVAGDDHWTLEAKAALRDQVDGHLRRLAVMRVLDRKASPRAGKGGRQVTPAARRYDELLASMPAEGPIQLDHLMVVVHALGQVS